MANRTIKGALAVHGQDPQLLVEKIIRERIYDSIYWKEKCFGLNAETILDRAVELDQIGGVYGNQRPVQFLCLLLKLLQIQPSRAVLEEYIKQEDFKYLRILALFYLRMVASARDVYLALEPFLADRRKLRIRLPDGSFGLTHLDEVVDDLLTKERLFGVILPRLTKRTILEDADQLEERPMLLGELEGDDREERRQAELPDTSNNHQDRMSLSIGETNALRIQLGLKPLDV